MLPIARRMIATAPAIPRPSHAKTAAGRWHADTASVVLILMLTAVGSWDLLVGGTTVGQDTAAFFYPMYAALGERLAAGDIPGWNPHQFAGVPFAADPESGWMYLPAMVLFALLPLAVAAKSWIVFHLLLPGITTYALARRLGIGAVGALTAAVSYEFSGLLYGRTVCCPAYSQVAAWMPPLILGLEMALRSRSWTGRVAWWGAAGFALSQILASWIGQGAYYALLALGGYCLYRTVVDPPHDRPAIPIRLGRLALHGVAVLLTGFGLAAAGILPRLAYHARTNLADGYTGDSAWAAVLGGWTPSIMVDQLLGPTIYYAGGVTLGLAVAAPFLAGRRHGVPYFVALAAGALILASQSTTPLHALLYATLPRFEELHRHWPERDMTVFILGPALLAGTTVQSLDRSRRWPALMACLALLPVLAVALVRDQIIPIPRATVGALVLACLLLTGYAALRLAPVRRLVPVLLVVVIFVDLFAVGRSNLAHGPYGGYHEFDLEAYATANGAAAFLQPRQEIEPARFFGYDPGLPQLIGLSNPPYRYSFADPRAMALLLNNRATLLGLQDLQGYNPLRPQRHLEYMTALNGFSQDYHEANVYAPGLDSPLLDLLNARYIVVPATAGPDRADLARLRAAHPTVYQDTTVAVLENRDALPRAWIVHEAQRVPRGDALRLLAAGMVDPRTVALLEEAPPPLAAAADPASDHAVVTVYEADRLRLETRTDAPGLLMMSEAHDPDWRAYVDGAPVKLFVADHMLRAVPVPAGAHVVELRYESGRLQTGLAVSLVAYAGLAVLLGAAGWRRWRPGRAGHALSSRRPLGIDGD